MDNLPAQYTATLARIVAALQPDVTRYRQTQIDLAALCLTQVIDPVNQQAAYDGVWRNAHQMRYGMVTLNSDGSFYAEYDLFCADPDDARWLIDMVTAWGNADKLHCELQRTPREVSC